jgi:hypothetical protein
VNQTTSGRLFALQAFKRLVMGMYDMKNQGFLESFAQLKLPLENLELPRPAQRISFGPVIKPQLT